MPRYCRISPAGTDGEKDFRAIQRRRRHLLDGEARLRLRYHSTDMGPVVRPRRLFVSGGSRLSSNAALLWRELGRLLAKEDGLVMITGGLLRIRMKGSRLKAADLAIVEGFEEGLARRKIDPSGRLETYLPDPDLDFSEGLERFAKGSVRVLSNRTSQARRFHMVFASDVVISSRRR